MYRVTLDLPGVPHPAVLHRLVDAVATSNALWFLDQWAKGKDPPCCCKCAGVLYKPEEPTPLGTWCVGLPRAFEMPTASCHTATAVSVGHSRAKDVRDGCPFEVAMNRHTVLLEQQGPVYWHALYLRPDGEVRDVTKKMEPAR